MRSEINTYKLNGGEAFVWHTKIYYSDKSLESTIESIFKELDRIRFKVAGRAYRNSIVGGHFLKCSSCYHSVLRDGYRYCDLFQKYIDDESGIFCVYHSKKLKTTNRKIIDKMLEFITQDGELDKNKILEKLSEDIHYFDGLFIGELKKELKV